MLRISAKTLLLALVWSVSCSMSWAQSGTARSCVGLPDASRCIDKVLAAAAAKGGGEILFPSGTYRFSRPIVMRNGLYLRGEGIDATRLLYTGAEVAINALGTDSNRILFRISDMTLNGSGARGSADGLWLGHNHRSNPALSRVKIEWFPRYGIYFKAEDWIVSFEHIEVSANGHIASNGAGLFKDVGVTDLNSIVFTDCIIEGNGSSSSAAGGVFLVSGSRGPTKGLTFRDCTIEGNFGTDQIYLSNVSGAVIDGLYLESDLTKGNALVGVEIYGGSGAISRSRFAVGGTDSRSTAIQLKSSGDMKVDNVVFSGEWGATLQLK